MIGILFKDFNLVACNFLTFYWCKMLNSCVDFSFNIFSLRMTVYLLLHIYCHCSYSFVRNFCAAGFKYLDLRKLDQ